MEDENITFSQEQQLAYNKYIQGDNIFITGPGGSGKSFFIQSAILIDVKNKIILVTFLDNLKFLSKL